VSRVVRQPPSARVQKTASSERWSRRKGRWRERHVLPEAQFAGGLEHAPDLGERGGGIGDGAEQAHRDDSVEASVLRRQRLGRSFGDLVRNGGGASALVPRRLARSGRVRPRGAASPSSDSARTSVRRRSRPRAPVRATQPGAAAAARARNRVGPLPLPLLQVAAEARLVRAVQRRTGLPSGAVASVVSSMCFVTRGALRSTSTSFSTCRDWPAGKAWSP
jgi:hypothetical protein